MRGTFIKNFLVEITQDYFLKIWRTLSVHFGLLILFKAFTTLHGRIYPFFCHYSMYERVCFPSFTGTVYDQLF